MNDMFSVTANKLMALKEGYRDDETYGSGVGDFEAIMRFEVFELGNKDIFYTFKIYNPKIDLRKSREFVINQIMVFCCNKFRTKKVVCKMANK